MRSLIALTALLIAGPTLAQVSEVAPAPSITPLTHAERVQALRAEIKALRAQRRAEAQIDALRAERDCLRAGGTDCRPIKTQKGSTK